MGRPRKNSPTDAEMTILQVMWRLGPATKRDIRDALPADTRPSEQALEQAVSVMKEKRLVRVVDARRPQKLEATVSQQRTYASLVQDFQKRVFGGSLRDLVQHALAGRKHSADEIAEVKRVLHQIERGEDGTRSR